MRQRWQVAAWVIGGLVLAGLGVWGSIANLDAASRVASVVCAIGTLIGLGLSGYGIVLARRTVTPMPAPQPNTGGVGGGDVHQRVRAGRDAYVAGRDQHFGTGGPGSR